MISMSLWFFFFFQAEDGIRDYKVTGVQTCALPILASYFPLAGDGSGRAARGSDTLTAHLLNLSALAQGVDKRFVLPAAERERMENGLIAFVEGRIQRSFWSPRKDLDMRKLAAIQALALKIGRAHV